MMADKIERFNENRNVIGKIGEQSENEPNIEEKPDPML